MPRFGELLDTDVWAAATRTLTAFAAEEIFDLPAIDDAYPKVLALSSAVVDTFGSWVEISADVGTGKRLVALSISPWTGLSEAQSADIEIGEGAAGSEAAITHVPIPSGSSISTSRVPVYLWRALTDNARLSVRVKDEDAAANNYSISPYIA